MTARSTHASLVPRRVRLPHRRGADAWIAGDGDPIVLLHGWGLSGAAYRGAMISLAGRGRRVIAPSVTVTGDVWTLPRAAAVAAEAMAAHGAVRAPIVGHSFGSAVAVRLAVDEPALVSALVLADPVGVSPGVLRLARIALPGRQWRVAANGATAGALARTVATRGAFRGLAGAARWILRHGLEAELRTVRDTAVPAAVLWAEADSVLPRRVGERVAAQLGAPLQIVERGPGWPHRRPPDHDWPFRAPGFFARTVLETLAGLLPPTMSE